MNIVAAGVHHAGNRGGVGQLGLLDDGQCVDIGAQSRGEGAVSDVEMCIRDRFQCDRALVMCAGIFEPRRGNMRSSST